MPLSPRHLVAFLAAALCLTLFLAAGFSDGASASFNHTWAAEFGSALSLSDLYPKHLPGLWSGLGGYDFFFYGPLPFWVAGGLIAPLCPSCATGTEIVLTAAAFWFLSGATFFLFARRYFSTKIALLGSFVYLFLPYHLWIDWFLRQAIGEFAGFAFLPLIAFGVDSVRCQQKYGWTLAIGVAGLVLCHLPTMLLAAHVFAIILIAVAVQKWRRNQPFIPFLASVVGWVFLGILMTSFYWLPALALLESVSPNILFSDFFEAKNWLWGTASGTPQPQTSIVMLSAFLVTLPTVALSLFYARGSVLVWIAPSVFFVVLMNSNLSEPIWSTWIIQKVQFPWRLLVFSDFAAGVAVMALLAALAPHNRTRVAIILVVAALAPLFKVMLPSAGAIMTPFDETSLPRGAIEYLSPETNAALEKRYGIELSHTKHILMVPKMLEIVVNEVHSQLPDGIAIDSAPRAYTIANAPDQQNLVLPIQYWQFWTAQLDDGTPLQLTAHPDYGVIEVLSPDEGFNGQTIHLTLPYHISEKIGLVLALLSVAAFAYLIGTVRRRQKPDPDDVLQHIQ